MRRTLPCCIGTIPRWHAPRRMWMMGQARPAHLSRTRASFTFIRRPPSTKRSPCWTRPARAGFGFTAQGKTDIVINRLKEEAGEARPPTASLIQGVGDQPGGSVSTGFGQANAYGNHATAGWHRILRKRKRTKWAAEIAIYVEPN